MLKNLSLIFLILLSAKIFSQQSDKISFESGSVVDVAFKDQGIFFKQNLFSSNFFKFEYVGKSWAKKNWSIFIPLGISYMRLKNSYGMEGEGLNTFIYHNINLCFGPQVQYQSQKIRTCLGVFINSLLNIHIQNTYSQSPLNTTFYSSNNFTGFGGYMSGRFFCLHKVGSKTWIGPSCEVFFLDFVYVYDEIAQRKNSTYQKVNLVGVNGSSL